MGVNHGTLVSAAILILLVARRHDFVLPGDQQTRYLIATRTLVAAIRSQPSGARSCG